MQLPDPERFADGDWPVPDGDPAPDPVRLALVGLGEFTTGWVAPSAAASRYTTVGAVVSGSPDVAARAAETHDATALSYEAFADGTATDDYDAVYVSTPNATHTDHVRTAAAQGKAVLCEKPVAATLEGARTVRDVCAEAGVPLQVAYRLQTDPVVRWARAAVRAGAVGEPVHARGTMGQDLFEQVSPDPDQWRLDHDLSGGAALIDLGLYPLNTTRFLVDRDPTAVTATTASPDDRFADVDQHVAFTLAFGDGLQAAHTASQLSARADHLELVGTAGRLVLEPAFFGDVTARLERPDREVTVAFPEVNEMRRQLEYFGAHVIRGADPEPDGDHALVDAAVVDACYRAARTGERVAVPAMDQDQDQDRD